MMVREGEQFQKATRQKTVPAETYGIFTMSNTN